MGLKVEDVTDRTKCGAEGGGCNGQETQSVTDRTKWG